MRLSNVVLLVAAVALSSVLQASPIRIASWNLEHLAERDGEGCRPRTEADYAELRRHAAAIGADVVALQEVESQRAAERVFPRDAWTVVVETRTMQPGGSCRENPANSIRAQLTGIAIRKGLPFARNPDFAALTLGRPGLRAGVDVTLNVTKPIRILAVHLKSGCNSGNTPTDADCPILMAQVPILETWIDARGREGVATVIAGDFNRRLASSGDIIWAELDDADPPASDMTLGSGSAGAKCKARYREFIDFVVLNKPAAAALLPGSFAEYRYGGSAENEHPSDHCPVSVAIDIK